LQKLHAGILWHRFVQGRWSLRRLGERLFDSIHIEPACVAALKASKNLAGLRDLARLIVENAERGVAARPLGKEIDGALEPLGRLWRFTFEHGDNAEPPRNFARRRNSCQPLPQRCRGAIEIFASQLRERERQIVLIVVGIAMDRVAENFGGARRVAEMRVDVAEQREIGIVLAAFFGDLIRRIERLLIKTFAKIGVGEIEFCVVGFGIGFQRGLKMRDGVVVEAITR